MIMITRQSQSRFIIQQFCRFIPVIVLILLAAPKLSFGAGTEVKWAKEPVFVDVALPSLSSWISNEESIAAEAQKIVTMRLNDVAAKHPGQLITLRVQGLKLNYSDLSSEDQQYVTGLVGEAESVDSFYQEKVSDFFAEALAQVKEAPVSFAGLPLESNRTIESTTAQKTNKHFSALINELDAFITTKTLIYSDGETTINSAVISSSLPQSITLAQGRPIVFPTNHGWQMAFDSPTEPFQAIPERDTALIFHELSRHLPQEFYDRIESEWGILPILLVTNWAFDPENDGVWYPEITDRAITRYQELWGYPPDYDGYICLDWEQPWMGYLIGKWTDQGWLYGPGTPEGERALQDGIGLLAAFRQAWPNAKLGFYGLPTREYWHQDDNWRNNNVNQLSQLLADADFVSPSLYELYGTTKIRNEEIVEGEGAKDRYVERYQAITKLALEVAGEKPVLPWVHGHWHKNAGPPFAGSQIPSARYTWWIESMKEVQFDGRSISGVVQYGLTIQEPEADRLFCILMDIFNGQECGVSWADATMPMDQGDEDETEVCAIVHTDPSYDPVADIRLHWGKTDSYWDLNGDGIVDINDLNLLLANKADYSEASWWEEEMGEDDSLSGLQDVLALAGTDDMGSGGYYGVGSSPSGGPSGGGSSGSNAGCTVGR